MSISKNLLALDTGVKQNRSRKVPRIARREKKKKTQAEQTTVFSFFFLLKGKSSFRVFIESRVVALSVRAAAFS